MKQKSTINILNNVNRNFFGGLFVLFFSFSSIAQVKTTADTTSIKIGEELRVQYEVLADSTDLVVFPDQQTFAPLEVIESYETDTTYEASKIRLIKRYGLTQFDSGSYTIPPQKIIFNNKFYTSDSINVEVRDVAVDTTKQKMFDIKPVVSVEKPPFKWERIFYWLLPLLLLAGSLWYYFRRKKKKAEAEKQLPPYEEAIVALQQLDKSEYLIQNKSKEYYSLLTEIVKRYLDREVDDAAQESTTDELIERLQLHKDAGHFEFEAEDIKRLSDILKRADLVKFAKMQQASGQAEADRAATEEIINHTHEAIPEPTEEERLQDELYKEEARKKRLKKRVLMGTLAGVVVLGIATVVLGSVYGFGAVKDSVFGNESKTLLEGEWVNSEYGAPAIIIETPEVLLRKETGIPAEFADVVLSTSQFEYGQKKDHFSILLNTTKYRDSVPLDLSQSLEAGLQKIEVDGAINMIVKREDFKTDSGIEGLKAYGDFNLQDANGNTLEEKREYTMLMFKQEQAMQMVLMFNEFDNDYIKQIKERIIQSIEIEVTEKQQQNAQ
ncbi:BatD family protein [Patiriisocius marinistellae]|nr:BatD family protein [Patiriisocius marinistellae]